MDRSYTTGGIEKKLLSDTMTVSKAKSTKKKRLRHTAVLEEEVVPEDLVVNMVEEKEII